MPHLWLRVVRRTAAGAWPVLSVAAVAVAAVAVAAVCCWRKSRTTCLTYGCMWCEELQQVRLALVCGTRHAHHSADLKVLHHLSELHKQTTGCRRKD
jgi:hypothetical protein